MNEIMYWISEGKIIQIYNNKISKFDPTYPLTNRFILWKSKGISKFI